MTARDGTQPYANHVCVSAQQKAKSRCDPKDSKESFRLSGNTSRIPPVLPLPFRLASKLVQLRGGQLHQKRYEANYCSAALSAAFSNFATAALPGAWSERRRALDRNAGMTADGRSYLTPSRVATSEVDLAVAVRAAKSATSQDVCICCANELPLARPVDLSLLHKPSATADKCKRLNHINRDPPR
jgi:hypothetical protein